MAGRETPEEVWGLLGDETLADDDEFGVLAAEHEAMLAAFRSRNWAEARSRVEAAAPLAERFHLAALHRLYRDRIAAFEAAPPADDWDGSFSVAKPDAVEA